MMMDFWKLNKVAPSIYVAVPNIATILDILATVLGRYRGVLDLANTFFSIPLATESQEQLTFT